ncbi:serine hydrolase domain-containing protein [Kitasatospora sp. NPDC048365]|uniref:serine hydrolase domain-containing protein n=1 Tax=Kitasatospora sp. NPDC048365 TaxID=3364050 RepID=UPI00371F6907
MTDLGDLVQRTADRLAEQRAGVVVAAVAGGATEIRGAGRTGGHDGAVPGPDTVFEIGSVTKVFTALALARLAVAGATALDEPLADLLPPGARVPARDGVAITLRDLATHTSGLPRLPKGMLLGALLRPHAPDPYAGCTADRLLDGLARTRLGAVPGRRFRYSNLGAGLLGLALARRAGGTYGDLVGRLVTGPLGLADTRLDSDPARTAQGHSARLQPVPHWHLADLAGAGGLRSTGADLARFLQEQLDPGRGQSAEAIALTRTVEHPVAPVAAVHLGWMSLRLHPRQGGHRRYWHNGGTGGFTSYLGFDPEHGVGVLALANTARSVDSAAELLTDLQSAA